MATWRPTTPAPADGVGPPPPHASRKRPRGPLVWLERLLLVIAVMTLSYYAYVSAEAYLYQAFENRELDAILSSAPAPAPAPAVTAARPRLARGDTVGRIEIPRLGVSVVVRSGTDARTLQLAVGHIPGTALPGDVGNVGLAGHRDTFFRRLRDIKPDDDIVMKTPHGVFTYRVERTVVVEPEDVWVLDPTDSPTLTLVTCYPFTYFGSAPQRFIVRAALQDDPGGPQALTSADLSR